MKITFLERPTVANAAVNHADLFATVGRSYRSGVCCATARQQLNIQKAKGCGFLTAAA
ncbi:hypothetical protein [Pseudomonas sp. Leaf127]|uniref:hypothetical protein n=1 Tax=Pseudomonas sp. Leaf127 TaxID=1736267 RepID=UPI0012E8D797|nr:hypothetical protein [Pseudomonas sp. Leaf127]